MILRRVLVRVFHARCVGVTRGAVRSRWIERTREAEFCPSSRDARATAGTAARSQQLEDAYARLQAL